jgi:Fe-S-cluster containining protein
MIVDCIEYSSPVESAKRHNRTGKCDSKKCKAACCRFACLNVEERKPCIDYFKGLGFKSEIIAGKRYLILEKDCKYLDLKTYKCKRYDRRPIPCRHFTIPTDIVYKRVMKKCTFKFKLDKQELKSTPENL